MPRSEAQKRADRKYDAKRKGLRTRNWATVVYPDSAPDGWLSRLEESCVAAFVSPLHNRDMENGVAKKEHFHVLVMYDNPVMPEQFDELRERIGGVGHLKVESLRGQARYLCHMDSPDKAQYNSAEVIQLGGVDYLQACSSGSDRKKAIKEMMDYCDETGTYSYAELMQYAATHNAEWFEALVTHSTYVMVTYLKARRLDWRF